MSDKPIVPQPVAARLDYTKMYGKLGVEFGKTSGGQAVAEECPFCGKDRFYLSITSGKYQCKQCQMKGNVYTFLTWFHKRLLKETSSEHYLDLKHKRGIASQTFERHELAYDAGHDRWLIPFKSKKNNVVNIQFYHPHMKAKHNKFNLPGLPIRLYGLNNLSDDKDKPVFICEGPFDAIALDYNIGNKNRGKYDIVASPGSFKDKWVEHFKGRKVRVCYDNDNGGREQGERVRKLLGESGVADEVLILKWPEDYPTGCDINDLVRNPKYKDIKIVGFVKSHSVKAIRKPKLDWQDGWNCTDDGPEVIDWVWPNHLRCGSYISYSGFRGTCKSTIVRELVALYTTGQPMPKCEELGLPAGHAIYVTAEDSVKTAWASLELAGADKKNLSVLPAILADGDPMNILDHLEELRQKIKQHGTRLVVIDGQNSVVGAPNISTDMLARHNVTNKLHQFAQKENICLIGVRNEDPEGRAYGPASMGDLARGIMRSVEDEKLKGERYFRLVFDRISDAPPQPDIPYMVKDLGGSSRKILWGKGIGEKVKMAFPKKGGEG